MQRPPADHSGSTIWPGQSLNRRAVYRFSEEGTSRLLGGYLLAVGACAQKDLDRALNRQNELLSRDRHLPLGQILLDAQIVRPEQLQAALKQQSVDFLCADSPFFTHMERETVAGIYALSEHRLFEPQDLVFQQGDPGNTVFVVLRGSVNLTHRLQNGLEIETGIVRPGEIFGEMGPLTGNPRFVTVRALERSAVLAVPAETLFRDHEREPMLGQEVIKKWFRSAVDGRMQSRLFHDYHYRELLSQRETRPCVPLIGSSKRTVLFKERVMDMAVSGRPVLVAGEQGTMKTRIAGFIHDNSPQSAGPFLVFNSHRIPGFVSSCLPPGFQPIDMDEVVQLGALFGFDPLILPPSQPPWDGFLKLARNGTLVITGVHDLKAKVQQELAAYISSGTFHPLGSEKPERAGTRIVVTADDALDLHGDLLLSLIRHRIFLPPLRRRKRDLKEVTNGIAHYLGNELNKPIQGVDEEALNKIVAYDWPGNDRELEGEIYRGVSLSKSDRLTDEDVFIGEAPVAGKPAFNLLTVPLVRRLFESPLYPKVFRLAMTVMFCLVIGMGLWGNPMAESNVSLLLIWANWEPVLILGCLLLARMWCSMCPIGLVVEWVRSVPLPRIRIPQRYHRHGYWVSALGLALIFWAQATWDMWNDPLATAWLLLAITGTAVIFAVAAEGNIWCRYACPLGMMVGTLARTAIIEVRANVNYCRNECRDYECSTGHGGLPGCQMGKGPFSMQTNQDCILCGNCVKVCPHRSVRINLRPPGWEMCNASGADLAAVVFIPLLWGTQLFRAGIFAAWGQSLVQGAGSVPLGLFMAGTVGFGFAFCWIGALAFRYIASGGGWRSASTFVLAALPIVYAYEVALRLEPLLNRAADFFRVVSNQIGYDFPRMAFRLDLQSIAILKVLVLLLGTAVAFVVAERLAAGLPRAGKRPAWIKHLPLAVMGGLSIAAL